MAYLELVRHGKSEWNQTGQWTGWTDIPLAPEGIAEAERTGQELKRSGILFDRAYTSDLIRAQQTLDTILKTTGQTNIPIIEAPELKERNYGDFTGKNKWDLQKQLGDEEFQRVRRAWDYPPPNGESLKMVSERTVPYYESEIEPKLRQGENILVTAHGNSLRALVKYLEGISDADVEKLEIGTGEAWEYEIDPEGKVIHKQIRGINENRGKV